MKLPRIINTGNTRTRQTAFGGLNHTLAARNGEIFSMKNLTSNYYPLLAVRPKRFTVASLTAPHGLYSAGSLFYVDGTTLYKDGVSIGTVSDSDKLFCALGERIVIFPDKKIYENGELKNLESSYSASGLTFKDGTYAGQEAKANTIYKSGASWANHFKVGDAVTISGCTIHEENNKTPIIREIDGDNLIFYEHTFELGGDETTSYTETGTVTLARTVPDLDFILANENRVWGCKGDSIYCCKLGDPYNWNCFDGLSTDSWSVNSGTPGNFTAAIAFIGYPVFFKEDLIIKVYGSNQKNFETIASATLGVMEGSSKSLAVAGDVLYYLSKTGPVAYTGGMPSPISEKLGEVHYHDGVAGSDGLKYYLSCLDDNDNSVLLVYDSQKGTWHKEDALSIRYAAFKDGLYVLTSGDDLMLIGNPIEVPSDATAENDFDSVAEFADFDLQTFKFKHLVRLRLRLEVSAGAQLKIYTKFDNEAYSLSGAVAGGQAGLPKSFRIHPVAIKRCDHFRIKLVGTGGWKLHAIEYEQYSGGRK